MLTDVLGIIQHWIPAYVIDAVLRLLGRKPFMVKAIGKVDAGIKSLEYFTSNEWVWDNDNSIELERELNSTDRECFDFRGAIQLTFWSWPSFVPRTWPRTWPKCSQIGTRASSISHCLGRPRFNWNNFVAQI